MLLQVLKLLLNWIFVCGIVQMCHYAMVNKVNTDRQTHREATLMRKKDTKIHKIYFLADFIFPI